MGINGLLPLLKSIHKPCNLQKFAGKTIAVDAYGWLHRGTVACAMELAMGKPTRKFVDFAMHRVRMLLHFGVIPFLIFDGDYLPSKAATESDRAKRREESRNAGLELLKAGKTSQAYLELQKAVDVTPFMARQLIDELKKAGVQYIVAPYEADAQMVYLERRGVVDGILSEDSDLLVFGAKCLLTKLDQYGNCIEINRANFCACREISLTDWSDTEFRHMAILSGCDYLANINNMGLKTAYRMVRKYKTIEKVIRMLQFDGKFYVPNGYLEAFYQAELTFLHQRVFCPLSLKLVLHTEPEHPIDDIKMPFIGAYVEPDIAQGVARGDLDPMTKLPIVGVRKNKIVTPTSVPVVPPPQPERSASFNDLKKGKPIDTFFKPKRIPLGELDPNCFTPSPSQQEATRRNSGPWLASPVPRPYLSRSVTQSEHLLHSTPSTTSGHHGQTQTRPTTTSERRPSKRARLCADNEAVEFPEKLNQMTELGRSRFFSPGTSNPTPTTGRNVRREQSKKEEINIFSDDSIEEALLSLPDFDESANERPLACINTFVSSEDVKMEEGMKCRNSDPTGLTRRPASQTTTPSLTPSTSTTSSGGQPPTPGKSPSMSATLKDKFYFAAKGTSTTTKNGNLHALPRLSSSTASSSTTRSRIPLAVNAPNVKTSKSSVTNTKSSVTPLQRLGANAASRSRPPLTPPFTPPLTPICSLRTNAQRRSLLGTGSLPFPEVATEIKPAVVEPASIPLPEADEVENIALTAAAGSEDLIIHDSEEEEDDYTLCASTGEDYTTASIPDFGRFVYAG